MEVRERVQEQKEIDLINILRANYHKTALGKSNGTTSPTKDFLKWLNTNLEIKGKIRRVLDYGCGKGRDENTLKSEFPIFTGYDPHKDFGYDSSKQILQDSFDLVVCNYVLNVIVKVDRESVIKNLLRFLADGSVVLIGVRQDKYEVKDNWIRFQDGYITTRPTFQHFFTKKEIFEIFSNYAQITALNSKGAYVLISKITDRGRASQWIKKN
jgi:SAM-dependent methyltransferase